LKKFLIGIVLSSLAVMLVGCGSGRQSSNTSSSHQSQATKVSPKKHKRLASKKATSTSRTSASHATAASSNGGSSFASQLTDNDWYVLAYLKEWHYAISDANASPYFELTNGEIEQGTADSECKLVSTTATTVTVAPSSGEGAWSTFHNVTLNKADLIDQFVHSQDDVSLVAALTAKAVAKPDSYSNDDDTNDDNDDEDTNSDDEDTDDEDTDSNEDTTDDQDTDSQDDQDTDTQDDDQSTDDDSTADNEAWQVVTPAPIDQQTASVIKL